MILQGIPGRPPYDHGHDDRGGHPHIGVGFFGWRWWSNGYFFDGAGGGSGRQRSFHGQQFRSLVVDTGRAFPERWQYLRGFFGSSFRFAGR